ncbi:MAG: CpsD/CapB family tyrosine-protein kinase [Clostridia bacterium]
MKTKRELITQRDPKSPVSEVFRTLRTNIQFMNANKKLKTLLITSTFPSEGKSWIASNLAVTFAQADNKVILIDADMRKGRQYTIFGASPRPGLSNYLSGMDVEDGQEPDVTDYLQKTDIENLLIMTAGNIPPNPSELLVSPQMNKLLEDLKQACDIIIIDGTPCELVTDSVILSRIVDSTVIVTAHKETKKENLEKIIRNIQHVGGHLAGVVVNKMPISVKKYNEKYYYNSATGSTLNQTTSRREIKEKASNILKQNDDMYKEKKIEQRKSNTTNVNDDDESKNKMDKPSFIKNNNSGVDLDRSKDILNQINSYLDNEKKNLR